MLSNAVASIALTAQINPLSNALRSAMHMINGFATSAGKQMASIGGVPTHAPKGKSWLGYAAGHVAGEFAKRGIDMIVEQGKQAFDFQEQLIRFGIAARIGDNNLQGIARSMRQVSNETGLSAIEVLRGARAYVDMAGAAAFTVEKMRLLARVSQATKTDIGDLSQVVYQMQKNLKISDADLEESLSGVINMSKDGAVHFNQMAQEIAELAPQAARYGLVGRKGFNELTAMMQVARTGFASVSEMGTGITRVFTGLTMHAKQFRSYGVEIFNVGKDGTKTWKNFWEIFEAIRKNNVLGKDPELLRKAFGRSEADRTIRLWLENIDLMHQLEDAGKANGVVQQDLDRYTTSAAGRMSIAWEKVKNAIGDALTPERVESIVGGIEHMTQALGPLISAVGNVADGIGVIQAYWHKKVIERSTEDANTLSPEDRNFYEWARQARSIAKLTPEQEARMKRIEGVKNSYNSAVRDIMGSETETGAVTDRAIKQAIRYAHEDSSTPGGAQHVAAGHAYLDSRRDDISAERFMRLQAEVNAEIIKAVMANMNTPMPPQMMAAMSPLAAMFGQQVARVLRESMPPFTVSIDGNPIATAADNATDNRRR